MRHCLARSTIAILLALQLLSPSFVYAQGAVRQRDQSKIEPAKTAAAPEDQWKAPVRGEVISLTQNAVADSKPEPTIRVALATDVRSATISTTGHLMNTTDVASTLVAMDVTRVRV